MKKYVSSIVKTICALIIIFNVYIISVSLVRTDENKYSKLNSFSYIYDVVAYEERIKEEPENKVEIILPKKEETTTVEQEIIEKTEEIEKKENIEFPVLETFIGSITGYGPDCAGCDGRGYTSQGYNLITDGIYYNDAMFGSIRIVAADKSIAYGTVVRISGLKIYDQPFLAIVLDRGGAITGTKMDLAFETEADPLIKQIGYSKNIQYEVLRYGW